MSGLMLLREYFALCPDGICNKSVLTEEDRAFVKNGGLILTGVGQRANVPNGNGRVYRRSILEREMQKYQKLIDARVSYGELDHSANEVVELKNASHAVTEWHWQGDDLMIKVRVLSTTAGKEIKSIISDGFQVGFSSRALGSLQEAVGGGPATVNDDLQLICYDVVSWPSTAGAFGIPMPLNENQVARIRESINPDRFSLHALYRDFLEGLKR